MHNDEIIAAISDANVIVCVTAICEAVKRKLTSDTVKKAIENIKADDRKFWNQYKVSTFAIAALDLLGFNAYSGKDNDVKTLIISGLDVF